VLKEALAPQANDFAARIELASDFLIAQTLGRHQDHSGARYDKIR
jgi:hypothetical protein